jgi:hypothetical protein
MPSTPRRPRRLTLAVGGDFDQDQTGGIANLPIMFMELIDGAG